MAELIFRENKHSQPLYVTCLQIWEKVQTYEPSCGQFRKTRNHLDASISIFKFNSYEWVRKPCLWALEPVKRPIIETCHHDFSHLLCSSVQIQWEEEKIRERSTPHVSQTSSPSPMPMSPTKSHQRAFNVQQFSNNIIKFIGWVENYKQICILHI